MNTHERRETPRISLSSLVEVVVSDGRDAQAACRILDISPFGLRLEFIASKDAERFAHCQALTVARCAQAIQDMLLGKACEVRWRQGATLGARFRDPLAVSLEGLGMNLEFTSL